MKIAGLRAYCLRCALAQPFAFSQGWVGQRCATLVEVSTDEGITGWGEALCQGLQPPEIAGSVSADPCGLLRYGPGDSVTLHWTAFHPHQFATFKHAVVKGATELPAPITTSGVVTPAPGSHAETHTVADLLGSCTIAGFAETVSVWAMATDGWSRQSQYDDHAIQAFALAPEGA